MNVTARLYLPLALLALAACANDAATINRVQPDLVDKAMFDGAWFVRQTITDVPTNTGFSFVGETGELELIRWEIREDLLVGYRAYEKVPGSNSDAAQAGATPGSQPVSAGQGKGNDPTVYKDNPIVAYPIEKHVDVRREYNPATGEQSNVISENTSDRPWYERQFMRVDWSSPQVANFSFLFDALRADQTTSGYWVDNHEIGPDRFHVATNEAGEVDYFDLSNRMFVNPDVVSFDTNGDGIPDLAYPGCYLDVGTDCTGAEVTVRTSFLKVDEARELAYEPLFYDDQRQGEFGLFRTERATYDDRYGKTYEGMIYLANRHDLWEASVDAAGKPIPYAQRKLRPVVYALSPNYPEAMRAVTEQIGKDADAVFKRIAAFVRNQSVAALETDLTAQTGASCLFCIDENADGHARIGDLRYHFLYWVDDPQVASPLGYGPSAAHPETGRIVSGTAYVYGAGVDTYAQRAADMVRLMNGEVTDDDFLGGVDLARQVASRRLALDPRALDRAAHTAVTDTRASLLGEAASARVAKMRKDGIPNVLLPSRARVLDALEQAGIADQLVTPAMRQDFAAQHGLADARTLSDAQLAELKQTVLDPQRAVAAQQAIRQAAERRSLTLDYSDGAILGLAQEAKQKKLTGDALWQWLREQIYRGVMLHELGHTLGLRHNFGASVDALNYFPAYWPLREKTLGTVSTVDDLLRSNCALVDGTNQAACTAQESGKMVEYQYSSIMDYGARFNSDIHGYGLYDVAALASAYGDIVEVFDPSVVNGMDAGGRGLVREAADIRSPLFGHLGEKLHYSQLKAAFGSTENLAKRTWLTRSEYTKNKTKHLRVPYVGCYDEYVDATWFCHRWDQGADPFEVANYYANAYETDYFFNNFGRGRYGFGPIAVMQRVAERYLFPMTQAYQNAFFDLVYQTGDAYHQNYSQLAMQTAFTELWSVLSRPNYGAYALEDGVYALQSYEYDQPNAAYSIAPGEGRSTYSRYDLDAGYNLIDRVKESGHLYEQFAALQALTLADASRLGIGRDVVGGDLAYQIPFYLVFDQDLTQLFGSLFVEDASGFGPRTDGVNFYPSAIEAMDDAGAMQGTPIDPLVPWTVRINAAIYAMEGFRSNFSLDFARRCQIAIAGSGDELTPAANFETVRFEDALSGRVFLAYRDPSDTGRWPAAEILDRANALAAKLATMPNGTDDEKDAYQQVEFDLRSAVEDADTVHFLFAVLGRVPL